jgi:hypothetical protein
MADCFIEKKFIEKVKRKVQEEVQDDRYDGDYVMEDLDEAQKKRDLIDIDELPVL